jgi:hypothetical protein
MLNPTIMRYYLLDLQRMLALPYSLQSCDGNDITVLPHARGAQKCHSTAVPVVTQQLTLIVVGGRANLVG